MGIIQANLKKSVCTYRKFLAFVDLMVASYLITGYLAIIH